MPSPSLYLRTAEKKVFDELPTKLKDGWTVTKEEEQGDDRPEELLMRRRMTRFDALPECKDAMHQAQAGKDISACLSRIASSPSSGPALGELCFVLGTQVVSALLRAALRMVKTDEDLQGIAGLSAIRHAMIATNLASSLKRR